MVQNNHSSVWLKILTVVISVMLPFLIYGTVNLIQNDMKVKVLWGSDFVKEDRIQNLVQLMNAQNEILRTLCVANKEDIQEAKEDLRVITDRINKLTSTTRSLQPTTKKSEKDTARLEDILKKWEPLK